MDRQGVNERFDEKGLYEEAEARIMAEERERQIAQYQENLCAWEYTPRDPAEAGQECIDALAGMEAKYDALWRVLGGYDDGDISKTVVLEKDKHVAGLKNGTLNATICPGSYDPTKGPSSGWSVGVTFEENGVNGRYYSEREAELWMVSFCTAIQHDGGQGYYPFYSWSDRWNREKAAKAQAYLEELLPRFEASYQWLLEAACDPELNPDVSEQAQAYRQELPAAA